MSTDVLLVLALVYHSDVQARATRVCLFLRCGLLKAGSNKELRQVKHGLLQLSTLRVHVPKRGSCKGSFKGFTRVL